MADPTGGNTIAAVVTALGMATAAVVTAWATRKRSNNATAELPLPVDPEDRPARLRERLTALETKSQAHADHLEHVDDEITLLRAQEITVEGVVRDRQRRRRT